MRKGILLAGGAGTRLYPATKAISKQLMPVYDKPMIYYPLTTLMLSGIREILVISTPRDLPLFQNLLSDGTAFGLALSYAEQKEPNGLAEAFLIGRRFLEGAPSAMILGDNLFYGPGLAESLQAANQNQNGASVFSVRVQDPGRYGVVRFDAQEQPQEIIEKPKAPPSPYAVTGLYFYDAHACDLAESLKPSARGQLEITDLNNLYLAQGRLRIEKLRRGVTWLDAGTHESLHDASEFVRITEKRQGIKIGCPEETAFAMGYITRDAVLRQAAEIGGDYGDYLRIAVAAR